MQRSTLLLSFLIGLFMVTTKVDAQYAWDFGMHLGGANYLGEMGGKDQPRRDFVWDMKLGQTRWAVGGSTTPCSPPPPAVPALACDVGLGPDIKWHQKSAIMFAGHIAGHCAR